jgi:peptide chain release factor subunit 1
VQAVINEGGSVQHVQADTELKEHLVAASLRFPLPPDPLARVWLVAVCSCS